MYSFSQSSQSTLSEITPNILSYTRSNIIFDSSLIFAKDGIAIATSTLDEFLSSRIEAELGGSVYASCTHVGFDCWLLPGDWSSQCGLEQGFQAAIVVVLSFH